jgi:hypothetical protein
LPLWFASQRPRQHFLVRCRRGQVGALAYDVTKLGVRPVRVCTLPGPLRLPLEKKGTLLLTDVSALALRDQIALYDWLGTGAANLRVIALTSVPLDVLVARGVFLEGLFHRLGAVRFDLTAPQELQA